MASNFHIQKPYVLASLPRSVAQVDGKAVVGEVYGQRPGVKKRRRAEVSVGIDGEAANIYDIASSRLITSYPVPPQAKFSCAPCSVRLRSSAGKDATVARYTYIATREPARKLSLFKDTVEASGNTSSETVAASLGRSGDVVSLHTLSLPHSAVPDVAATTVPSSDLLAIDQDGQVTCFDGASLKEKYKVSVAGLAPDLVPRGANLKVEFAQMGVAGDVIKGLALGEDYVSGYFSQRVNADNNGFNPDVLFVVSTVTSRHAGPSRYLHLLAVDPNRQGNHQHQAALVQMHYIRLPAPAESDAATSPTYRLDVASGSLLTMDGDKVLSYDLSRSLPRVASQIAIADVSSFLRLSKSSILASTPTSFSVYNPLFQSLQASTGIDVETTTKSGAPLDDNKSTHTCTFVSYFPQLELAVALLDSNLVAVQLEPPRTRSRKRRADGLLIDSIGRGVSYAEGKAVEENAVLSKLYLPGTVSANYVSQLKDDIKAVDALMEQDDTAAFDDFLAEKLGIQSIADWRWQRPLDASTSGDAMDESQDGETAATAANGHATDDSANDDTTAQATSSSPPPSAARRHKYPETDRRWVLYAINRIITIADQRAGERLRFRCKLPSSDILNYLVDAGHLSVANAHSALRDQLRDVDEAELLLGEALPLMLAEVDPSLDLLVRWLYETKLSATELLSAILLLMRSLELVENTESKSAALKLLTNGTAVSGQAADGDAEDANSELDQLDQQLHLAEYFLQQVENDPRDLALDIAIGKLGNCPAVTTVQGLRRIFRTDEIRALIEVLRKQMVDQGWATRYMDMEGDEDSETDEKEAAGTQAPLNYSIRLIADLMARCIDAVRPGEWLINDEEASPAPLDADAFAGTNGSGGGDFFAQLKWQVSAALEGVQEALYLRGIVGETVRYGMSLQRQASAADNHSKSVAASASSSTASTRPARVNTNQSAAVLPIGMNAPNGMLRHPDVTRTKLVSANEVAKRTRREVGHLTSKKVGSYTLERIVF
ncbi:hypothetical protein F503_04921 [Ophiostoma piceae UAMH 11346]|uniref:Utp8 beta-propeller domain-containing protein n=1 Tax=Ophiostoma piceae (strain UAMH 11346) TaxID=1262450 RepID=S3CCL4_OPHP1|nr:hypothetical protein F503_04921 [Ophiostoma piceae UAMH 11346]